MRSVSVLPSDRPAVFFFTPRQQAGWGRFRPNLNLDKWAYDINEITDPEGFLELLPSLKLLNFYERQLTLKDLFSNSLRYDPRFRNEPERPIQAILYSTKGQDSFKNEYDFRLNHHEFTNAFEQKDWLLQKYKVNIKSPEIGHVWRSCDYARTLDPVTKKKGDLGWTITELTYSNRFSSNLWRRVKNLCKAIMETPVEHEPKTSWIIFTPPLESKEDGGLTVHSVLVGPRPYEEDPYKPLRFGPKPANCVTSKPFDLGVWYHANWGFRDNDPWVDNLRVPIEEASKFVSDYLHYRAESLPPWSYRAFSSKAVSWLKDASNTTIDAKKKAVVELINSTWDGLLNNFRGGLLLELNLYLRGHQLWLGLVEYLQSAIAILNRAPCPLGGSFSCTFSLLSSPALFYILNCLAFIILKCVVKIGPILLEAAGEAFYYPRLGLLYFFIYFLKPSVLALLWVSKILFFNFIFLSYTKYFLWLLVMVVSYVAISSFKEECAKDLEEQKEIPQWAHRWALQTLTRKLDKKKWYLRALLPIIINLVFGYPTLIGAGYQQWATLFLLAYIIPYLIILSLIYGKVISVDDLDLPLWMPKLIKKQTLFVERTATKKYGELSLEEKYDLFCDYPFLPPFIYDGLINLKTWFWKLVYYVTGLVLIVTAFTLLVILSINLEGLVGAPLAGESWTHCFLKGGWFGT